MAYTLLDEWSIQRVFQGIFKGNIGGVRDYLGIILEVFYNDSERKIVYKPTKNSPNPVYYYLLFTYLALNFLLTE